MQPRMLMQRCGYGEKITRKGVVSYVRRIKGPEFPRFHAYLDIGEAGFRVNLHLDQKGACYEGASAHSGEYDGPLVEEEGARIKDVIASISGFVEGGSEAKKPAASASVFDEIKYSEGDDYTSFDSGMKFG